MKKIEKSKNYLLILAMATIIISAGCENDFKADDVDPNTNPPSVTSISSIQEDTEVTQGVLQGNYMVRGENLSSMLSVRFNEFEASFNPALLTDDLAFVSVPLGTPLTGSNTMRIETLGGSTEVDFPLLRVLDFTEGVVDGVKVVNISGIGFSYSPTVSFNSGSENLGNLVERESKVISFTDEAIVAEVPAGVTQAFIYVTTERGATDVSGSYGFSLPIYIDELNADWGSSGWGGTQDFGSSEQALGSASVKSTREAWSGLTFLPNNGLAFNEYEFITVQIYASTNATKVNMALNDFDAGLALDLVPDTWNKFVIKLSDFYPTGGEPDQIMRIDFQEFSGSGQSQYIFYVDDFGFL